MNISSFSYCVAGLKTAEIGRIDLEAFELWRERRGGEEDDLIEPDTIINLSDPGLERFYKKKRPPKKIIIIVNGRRK